MWVVYTAEKGQRYPLQVGYKLISSGQIRHDYERITSYCRNGCPDYGSGGCPPHAPRLDTVVSAYPYALMVYAKFLSRFKPPELAVDDFSLQDVILSDVLGRFGYAALSQNRGGLFFLNCGHCRGCGDEPCTFKMEQESCRKPERRAYSIAATGVDVTKTLEEVFGITLLWGQADQQVEYIIKVMALLSPDPSIPQQIAQDLPLIFSRLDCVEGGGRAIVKQ